MAFERGQLDGFLAPKRRSQALRRNALESHARAGFLPVGDESREARQRRPTQEVIDRDEWPLLPLAPDRRANLLDRDAFAGSEEQAQRGVSHHVDVADVQIWARKDTKTVGDGQAETILPLIALKGE